MGNVCSISISCDAIFSRCIDCCVRKATFACQLEDNLDALKNALEDLIQARNDVMTRVLIAEQQHMKRLNRVQLWLTRVQAEEIEVSQLLQGIKSQQTENVGIGGFCSRNYKSTYKFGKKVDKKLKFVATLMSEGSDFQVVAERIPEVVVDERPSEPMIFGLESTFDKVWKCLAEEQVGIIGLYGMGGVGKTTLLTQINNKFFDTQNGFDFVMWIVVSKDLQIDKIQENIGKRIGLFDELWRNKSPEEKAIDIFKFLNKRKFVLLLDDVWERVNLIKVGVPVPSSKFSSKVVFTTRFIDICGLMEAHRKFKVECLQNEEAWKLFQNKVGEETLDSHPDIPELAKIVTKECGGLPLALITIGRAMAYKKTPEEWNFAIQVLKRSASEFPDCWIGEGFLDEFDRNEAQYKGYYIIGVLLHACLVEEEADRIKMHDVIRDMGLWIASDIEKENIMVQAGGGLTVLPEVTKWQGVRRMSMMENEIEDLLETSTFPHLLTLFLNSNRLMTIKCDFFHSMPLLKVLDLSCNRFLNALPSGISNLVSLQYLNLSRTSIKELPEELKLLANLKCLNLEHMIFLRTIPHQMICNFSMLHVFKMFSYNSPIYIAPDSVLCGGHEFLVEELLGLKHLNMLSITLKGTHALQRFLSSHMLQNCTQSLSLQLIDDSKSLSILTLAHMKHLQALHLVSENLKELKIDCKGEDVPEAPKRHGFHSLHTVDINSCVKLRHLTWLAFAPSLKFLYVSNCSSMEDIISAETLVEVSEMVRNLNLFAKLELLKLENLENLKSIYWDALPFSHLKEISVIGCPKLLKLPFNSNSAKVHKFLVKGQKSWWDELQWEDEATQNAFHPVSNMFEDFSAIFEFDFC
ncbi:NBS-LRR type disease resistance protein [Melia azedarach]|uniref:NBS-LRR type disease resistance protein n=1 Tax=Melia azedarach TaxID=155640 RepID=A0ACC1Y3J3_MELAZ|nr:NBS-LRR type disease resistance protein [Melia azedarach]